MPFRGWDSIALHRPFKARESTSASSEKYKSAIRGYMQSLGYGQTSDSLTEGHLADMIFVPLDERLDRRPVWVESKNTVLSASDPKFIKEIRGYVRDYLQRIPENRFHFMVFAAGIKNLPRWEEVFGSKVTDTSLRTWLEPDQTEGRERNPFAEFPGKASEIVNFFVDSVFTDADKPRLIELTEARKKMEIGAGDARARAKKFLGLLDQRSNPLYKKSILFANYLEFEPPKHYDLLEVEPRGESWIYDHLPAHRPPWVLLEKGRILTIATESSPEDFQAVGATRIDTLDLETLMGTHDAKLHELHCQILYLIATRRGIRTHPRVTYFNAYREVQKFEPRTILADGGELRVARPFYRQRGKPESAEDVETIVAQDKGNVGELRYVFHEGFHIDCVYMWSRFFARIHLQRCYSRDGYWLLDGRSSAALDAKFRNPTFNRAETQLRKVTMIGRYLFPKDLGFDAPEWRRKIRFKDFLKFDTLWTPESVEMRQTFISNGNGGPTP